MSINNDKLLNILRQNARIPDEDIAAMLSCDEDLVRLAIETLEQDGIIKGYAPLIDEEKYDKNSVTAQIELRVTPQAENGYDAVAGRIAQYREVDSVSLMSGGFDLLVIMRGSNFRDIALFVAENLATMNGVVSTKTHFILRRFKEKGVLFAVEEEDERGMISP